MFGALCDVNLVQRCLQVLVNLSQALRCQSFCVFEADSCVICRLKKSSDKILLCVARCKIINKKKRTAEEPKREPKPPPYLPLIIGDGLTAPFANYRNNYGCSRKYQRNCRADATFFSFGHGNPPLLWVIVIVAYIKPACGLIENKSAGGCNAVKHKTILCFLCVAYLLLVLFVCIKVIIRAITAAITKIILVLIVIVIGVIITVIIVIPC